MRIYISIPITNFDLATQRAKAAEIADKIKALGHEPVNPLDTPEPQGKLSERERYAYFMGEHIRQLLMCDAILLCERWNKSKGCRVEFNIAMVYGIDEYYSLSDIPVNPTPAYPK